MQRVDMEVYSIRRIGTVEYVFTKFKLADKDFWYYNSRSSETKAKKDELLEKELKYIGCLIADISARKLGFHFETEYYKWKRIMEEMMNHKNDIVRPIRAVQRRIHRSKCNQEIRIEIEKSINCLLSYRNEKMGILMDSFEDIFIKV